MKKLTNNDAWEKINRGKDCIKKGSHNLTLDMFDETIEGLCFKQSFTSRLLASEAMRLLGVALGWQILDQQTDISNPAHLKFTENEWKPVFSCLRSALAYQNAIGDMFGRSASIALIFIFRIARGEDPMQVGEEMKEDIWTIRQERMKAQDGDTIKRLADLEHLIYSRVTGADLKELRNLTEVIMDL